MSKIRKELNRTKAYHYSLFKRGYSEGTYPLNVFEFVMIMSTMLLTLHILGANFAEVFFGVTAVIIISMYAVGRWNMDETNRRSLYKQDLLADPWAQIDFRAQRDIMLKLGMEKSAQDISQWIKEPIDEARKRVAEG